MNTPGDSYLRNMLKQWVCQYRPPENGRYRLVRMAAHLSAYRSAELPAAFNLRYRQQTPIVPPDWCHQMFTWSVLYPFKTAW